MTAWESILGVSGLDAMTAYVASLSANQQTDDSTHSAKNTLAISQRTLNKAAEQFQTLCSACHGSDAKGNYAFGAPNLTDSIWLYGGSNVQIRHTIAKGRSGQMPAHKDSLEHHKIHLLTAYVIHLSTSSKAGSTPDNSPISSHHE
jgi:cytochrome c oxidase cbb3-type subunit 3